IVLPDGPMCWCGNRGCLEEVASLHALVRYVDDRLRDRKRRAQSRIGRSEDPEELDAFGAVDDPSQSAEEVLRSASLGDRDCLEAVDQVAKYLGRGLFNLLQLFDPEVVVIEVSVG